MGITLIRQQCDCDMFSYHNTIWWRTWSSTRTWGTEELEPQWDCGFIHWHNELVGQWKIHTKPRNLKHHMQLLMSPRLQSIIEIAPLSIPQENTTTFAIRQKPWLRFTCLVMRLMCRKFWYHNSTNEWLRGGLHRSFPLLRSSWTIRLLADSEIFRDEMKK